MEQKKIEEKLNVSNNFCILECEDIKKRTLFDFHKKFINLIEKPKVLILLWTTEDMEKKKEYKKIIKDYFEDLEIKDVLFLKENDEKIKEKFENSNILYLPGGDTKCFLTKVKEKPEIINEIRNFKGSTIGNSAGAIILSTKGYSYKEGKIIKYKGLGILKVKVFVHFKPEYLQSLKEKNIISISDSEVVTFIK